MIVGIDPIILFVKDFERQLSFYRDSVGLKYKGGDFGWAEFQVGSTVFALHGGFKGHVPKNNNVVVHFTVKDIQGVAKELRARGVNFTKDVTLEDFGAYQATFEDPEGNEFDLIEEAPHVPKVRVEESRRDHGATLRSDASGDRRS